MAGFIIVYPIRTSQTWQKWKSPPSSTSSSKNSTRPHSRQRALKPRPCDDPRAPHPHPRTLKSLRTLWVGSPTLQNPRQWLPKRPRKTLLFLSSTCRLRKYAPKTKRRNKRKRPLLSCKPNRTQRSKMRTRQTQTLRMVCHLPRSFRWLAGPHCPLTCSSGSNRPAKSSSSTCSKTR